MDRRNFIGKLLAVGAGFTVLPPAATARIWKAQTPKPAPYLEVISDEPFPGARQFMGKWRFVMTDECGRFSEEQLYQSDWTYVVKSDPHPLRFEMERLTA